MVLEFGSRKYMSRDQIERKEARTSAERKELTGLSLKLCHWSVPTPLPVQLCQAVNESSVACALRELVVQQDRSNRTRSDVHFMAGEVQGSVRACDRGVSPILGTWRRRL